MQRRFEILVQNPEMKTHFLAGGAARLALLTLVTLGLILLSKPLGFGVVLGLVAFQLTLLVFSSAAMYKSVRP